METIEHCPLCLSRGTRRKATDRSFLERHRSGSSAQRGMAHGGIPRRRLEAIVSGGCKFDICGWRKSDSRQHGVAAG
jgi:hypothetical protein